MSKHAGFRPTRLVVGFFAVALASAGYQASCAYSADVPVAGDRLTLRDSAARPQNRSARIVLRDPAIAAPFSDPTAGATLVVNGGIASGQCFVEVALDPLRWQPISGDGAGRGYRYLDRDGTRMGVRRVEVRSGRIYVRARGPAWACALSANAQRLPLAVSLRSGGDRYCSSFGGTIRRNDPGRFSARQALAPAACPKSDLTVASQNILHGVFCPAPTASCRLSDRIDLLFQWIAASGCPDFVTLQEIWDPAVPLIDAHLATACSFPYQRVYIRTNGIDDAIILSRYPVGSSQVTRLLNNFRHVLHGRFDHPLGPVDVFTTHLASGSDGANLACGPSCPAECVTAGATTLRECQGVQMANLVAAAHDVSPAAVATGDFNVIPGSFVYNQFVNRGWSDTYLDAGNPACIPATGVGCTSGRIDDALTDLESPVSNESVRIDYVFLIPPLVQTCSLDGAADSDGDSSATRIFADLPNPFSPTCGPAPDPICWPSDHEGAELDLNCGP